MRPLPWRRKATAKWHVKQALPVGGEGVRENTETKGEIGAGIRERRIRRERNWRQYSKASALTSAMISRTSSTKTCGLSPSAASVAAALALSSPSSIIALLIPKYSELLAGGRRRIGAGMVGGGRRPGRGFQILALVAVAFFFFYVACSLGRGTKWMPRGLS